MPAKRYKPSRQERHLPAISAASAAGDGNRLKRYIKRALGDGVPISHIEEVILQCYLFAGFPAALEGLVVLRDTTGGLGRRRINVPPTSTKTIVNRGLKLCREVYGDKYEPLRKRSLELHPEIWSWMIREGYGKVLSRPPLDPATRELCVIATLVVTGWARQLRSHAHGALNVGCTPESVLYVVRIAGRVAGPWARRWALDLAREEIAAARSESRSHRTERRWARKAANKRTARGRKRAKQSPTSPGGTAKRRGRGK